MYLVLSGNIFNESRKEFHQWLLDQRIPFQRFGWKDRKHEKVTPPQYIPDK